MSDVTTNPEETVVQPPDDLVAKEVSAIVNYDSNKDKASRAKASNLTTPSTSTSNTSRVHIQETRNKRFTPAQQQRQEIYKSMVALFEAENKREDKEDEIDMAFTACAVRMHIHLNKDQIEDVIQEVEGVVCRAINNVQKGMPALTPSPVISMPAWCECDTKSDVRLSSHAAATTTAATTTSTTVYGNPGTDCNRTG